MRDDDVLESWRREYVTIRSKILQFFFTILFGCALGFILGHYVDLPS